MIRGLLPAVGVLVGLSSALAPSAAAQAPRPGAESVPVDVALTMPRWPVRMPLYLKAPNTDVEDSFGHAVAASGDTFVIGVPEEDSAATGIGGDASDDTAGRAGAVYVYVRDGAGWALQAYIKASNAQAGDRFGHALALDGDTLVVGAPDEDSPATGVNGVEDDDGIGALTSGAAYVFVRDGETWSQEAYLKASNTQRIDRFGSTVAVDGDTVVVAAPEEDSILSGVGAGQFADNSAFYDSGAVYVFVRSGTTWSQQEYIKASSADEDDRFGDGLAIEGDVLVVGAAFEDSAAQGIGGDDTDDSGADNGAVYVFTRSGTTWTQTEYLKGSDTDILDHFGAALSLEGDRLAVGAPGFDVGGSSNDGAAYLFTRSGAVWSEEARLVVPFPGPGAPRFGATLDLDGMLLVVGATGDSNNGYGLNNLTQAHHALPTFSTGAAYVYGRTGTTWTRQADLKASNPGLGAVQPFNIDGDHFGTVAVAGTTVVSGAIYEDGGGTGLGAVPDEGAEDAGAAYIFETAHATTHLLVGRGAGGASWREFPWSHEFTTQLDEVVASFPVDPGTLPAFVFKRPVAGGVRGATPTGPVGSAGSLPDDPAGLLPPTPSPVLPIDFTVQVVTWNPQSHPGQPERASHGLAVSLTAKGGLVTVPYGTATGGVTITAELDTDVQGRRVIRFPFTVP